MMMVCVGLCGRGRGGIFLFLFFSKESEWKSPLYGMKASKDYPLTMKFDDPPPSPSDTEFSFTLPWALNLGAYVKRL